MFFVIYNGSIVFRLCLIGLFKPVADDHQTIDHYIGEEIHFIRMRKKVDFLVIGSGIAGLSFALKVAPYGKVLVISKTKLGETNTAYAQGGIAAVTYEPDNFEKHIEDTMIAGTTFRIPKRYEW